MTFDIYEEWKLEQDHKAFNDFCSNLGIDLLDIYIERIRNDEILSELIIREHDSYFGVTHSKEEYQQYLEEELQDAYDAQGESQYEFLAGK